MDKGEFEKQKAVPRYLIPWLGQRNNPGTIKRHAAAIYAECEDQWRLFAEGCLRNRFFHEQVFKRGQKCLPCNRRFNSAEASVKSKIEKHHACYLRLCTGALLPENHEDIYRPAGEREFPYVPDCRSCATENPKYFEGCLKRIYPVHASCHERIHGKERHFRNKAKKDLLEQFHKAGRS